MNKLRYFLAVILVMSIGSSAFADEMLVFIGEYVEVKEWPYKDEYLAKCNCIVMDVRFTAKYKVKKVLHGNYDKDEITFTVHDHYGFPNFAKQKTALLYLVKGNEGLVHLKYAWDPVSPLKNGGFAACNDAFLDDNNQVDVKNYDFDPPIKVDLSHSTDHVINQYKANPLYNIIGNTAVCIKGISAEDLFTIRWPEIIEDYELDKKELEIKKR